MKPINFLHAISWRIWIRICYSGLLWEEIKWFLKKITGDQNSICLNCFIKYLKIIMWAMIKTVCIFFTINKKKYVNLIHRVSEYSFYFYYWIFRNTNKEIKIQSFLLKANAESSPKVPERDFFFFFNFPIKGKECLLFKHFKCMVLSEILFCFVFKSDLENFKTKMRSTVSVREGQGVVLLCGPPPHSGGNKCYVFASYIY